MDRVQVTAGFFGVEIEDNFDDLEKACKFDAMPKNRNAQWLDVDGRKFKMGNLHWNKESRILTGTIWKVRGLKLPSVITTTETRDLDLELDESLGEPASFAFSIPKRATIVEYNHNGPRHSVLRKYLSEKVPGPVIVEPLLSFDALEKLANAPVVRKIEVGLGSADLSSLRSAGTALSSAIDAMTELKGLRMKLEISVGTAPREKGLSNVKQLIKNLVNQKESVSVLKAKVRAKNHSTELLDLLGGRRITEFEVPLIGRRLDHSACRKQLRKELIALRK